LQRRFDQEAAFRSRRRQVRLMHGPVEAMAGQGVYDYIVSGLPFNNFPVGLVREIFQVYNRLLKPGGTLSYFEYVLIRHLQTPFVNRQERRRLSLVGRLVDRYIRSCQIRRQRVLMNVPPAVVRHLRLKPGLDPLEEAPVLALSSELLR
jgi:phospholipid N-methyltransferase